MDGNSCWRFSATWLKMPDTSPLTRFWNEPIMGADENPRFKAVAVSHLVNWEMGRKIRLA